MFVWWGGEWVKEWKNKMKGQGSKTPNLWNVSQTSLFHWLKPQFKLVVWEI